MKLFRRGWPRKGWLAGRFEKRAAISSNRGSSYSLHDRRINFQWTECLYFHISLEIFICPWCKIFSILSILYLFPFEVKVRIYSKELKTLKVKEKTILLSKKYNPFFKFFFWRFPLKRILRKKSISHKRQVQFKWFYWREAITVCLPQDSKGMGRMF